MTTRWGEVRQDVMAAGETTRSCRDSVEHSMVRAPEEPIGVRCWDRTSRSSLACCTRRPTRVELNCAGPAARPRSQVPARRNGAPARNWVPVPMGGTKVGGPRASKNDVVVEDVTRSVHSGAGGPTVDCSRERGLS